MTKGTNMKALTRILCAVAMVGVVAGAMPASAAVSAFRYPRNKLSPQFREGSCLYKIIYGNYGNVPFAIVHVYDGGACMLGDRKPYVTVNYGREGRQANSGYFSAGVRGSDRCGTFTAFQATGEAGYDVNDMGVAFPVTGNLKLFSPRSGRPTVPARSC
jgi:hypothetical protein